MASTPWRVGPLSLTAAAADMFTLGFTGTGTWGTTAYNGANGATYRVIKTCRLTNETALDVPATVSLGTDAAGKRIVKSINVPANGTVKLDDWVPMITGEKIQAYCGTLNAITITMAGLDQ